jgi:hypothetical protein
MLQVSIRVPGKEQKLYKEYMMKVLRDAALARAAGDVVSHVPGRAVVLRAAFGSLCCAVGIGSMPQQARASRGTSAVERSAVFFSLLKTLDKLLSPLTLLPSLSLTLSPSLSLSLSLLSFAPMGMCDMDGTNYD